VTRSRSNLGVVLPLLLLSFASVATVFAARPSPERPDILLITVDTLRPDALGWVARKNGTPALDALAAGGARSSNATAAAPLTLPSHLSLFTALHPRRHGVRDNGRVFPASGSETLAEALRRGGYRTAAFVSGFPLAAPFGADRGFDHYDDRFAATGALERPADATVDAANRWIGSSASGPWFVWVHLYDPHDPYLARDAEGAAAGARSAYDSEVRAVDRALAKLPAADLFPSRRRLTVFAGDHGESLGEHGESTHGLFVYQSSIAVPLVYSFPGVIAPRALPGRPRLVDVAPTVLELAALPAWPRRDGISIAAWLAGRSSTAAPAPPAIVESRRAWNSYGWAPLEAVLDGRWKLIAAPRPELYDLSADPGELRNLYDAERGVARQLASQLRSATEGAEAAAPTDPETLARLRALGYVGGDAAPQDRPSPDAPDPKDRVAIWNRMGEAEAALARNERRRALSGFEEVLVADPGNPFALARSADALAADGRLDEAIVRYRRSIALAPAQVESRIGLAQALIRLQKPSEAAAEWMEIVRRVPREPAYWLRLGGALGAAGRFREAAEAFQRVVELRPELPDGHLRLGFAALDMGDPRRAATALEKAAALAPDSFRSEAALGIALTDAGRAEAAPAWLERSRRSDPHFAEAMLRLAILRAANGRREEARSALRAALEADPALSGRVEREAGLRGLLEREE
jgi:arylsulfatase A-like enzyme/Tfp pilus assembly protein PilF